MFALSVTAPIFVMVALGILLKNRKAINDEFIRVASGLVFNVGLPVILFTSTATRDFSQLINPSHLAAVVIATLMVFFLASLTARWRVQDKRDHGVYVQGAFRGNLVIIGLAFCANAYGEQGLAIAALPVAVLIVLYNMLSVYTLTSSLSGDQTFPQTLLAMLKNPLILGIVTGLLNNALQIQLPALVLESSRYLGQMTLPLALLCIGGSLNLRQLHQSKGVALGASAWKLVLSPLALLLIALMLGIRGMELGVLFLLSACPSATAGFVMVRAMGGNAELAANIILVSTLLSLFTVTGGLLMLKAWGVI